MSYEHRRLTEAEVRLVDDRLANPFDPPTGIFYDGHLVTVVMDDSSGIGSGVASLMNAVEALAHVTQPERPLWSPEEE